MEIVDLKELLLTTHSSLLSKQNGKNTPKIKETKKSALSVFAEKGFPTTKNEEWKYTNISPLLKKDFAFELDANFGRDDLRQFLLPDLKANTFVFINGKFSRNLSEVLDKEGNFEIINLSEVPASTREDYFEKAQSKDDPFSSLNLAFADNGAVLTVPYGKTPEYPIVFYYISDKRTQSVFTQPRLTVFARENAQLTLVEYHVTLGAQESFSNAYTEIYLSQNAFVDFYKIQSEGEGAYHVGTTQVTHQAKSHFSSTTITLGGTLVRNNLNVHMNAERAECFLYGLYLAAGNRHIDTHSTVDHAMPNCYSNELYKGILNDKSTGVFNGKILVRQDAQKTNAFQSNKNILLSADATMNTKPQLEIFADDVKCSHGATVGQLDEEPLFYLRSRGLSEKKAKTLLTLAFAGDILEHIKIPGLKEFMKMQIAENLSKE